MIKCFYCNKQCVLGAYDGVYSTDNEIWICRHDDKTVKHYVQPKDIVNESRNYYCPAGTPHAIIIFGWKHDGYDWEIAYFPPTNRFRVDRSNRPPSKGGHVILDFHFFPEGFCPEKIEEKIPKWLTFS